MTNSTVRRTLMMTFAFVAGLLASAAARSEDFAFSVPVDLKNLPSGPKVWLVRCDVLDAAPPGGSRIASGQATVPVANGGHQGNVTVRFNNPAALANAKGYRCMLMIASGAGIEESAANVPHRQGTTFTPEVRGAINP